MNVDALWSVPTMYWEKVKVKHAWQVCLQALLFVLLQKYQCSCLELSWVLWIISPLGEYPKCPSIIHEYLQSCVQHTGKYIRVFYFSVWLQDLPLFPPVLATVLIYSFSYLAKISWVSELLVQILDHLLVVSLLYSYLFLFLGWLVSPVSLFHLLSSVVRNFRGNGTWQLLQARKGDFRNIMCSEKLKPREHK